MDVVDRSPVNGGKKNGAVGLGVEAALPAQAAKRAPETLGNGTDRAVAVECDGLGETPSGLAVPAVQLLEGLFVTSGGLADQIDLGAEGGCGC